MLSQRIALCPTSENVSRSKEVSETTTTTIHSSSHTQSIDERFENLKEQIALSSNPELLISDLENNLKWFEEQHIPVVERALVMEDPIQCMDFQKENLQTCVDLASRLEESSLRARIENTQHQSELVSQFLKLHPDYREKGTKPNSKPIKLYADGREIRFNRIRYCVPKSNAKKGEKKRGRPRQKRGEEGSGCDVVLESKGIVEGVTPALASEVSRLGTTGPSFKAASEELARRGIHLDEDQVQIISERFGADALSLRRDWIRTGLLPKGLLPLMKEDATILYIGEDGFKLQVRLPKKGRPPDGKTQPGYWTKFTESKAFNIRPLDSKLRLAGDSLPLNDGTLGSADDMFALLECMLRSGVLDLDKYDAIVFAGDGADWIWDRVEELIERLNLPREKVYQVVDWYHAVERLAAIADLRKGWNKRGKKIWLNRCKKYLWAGEIDGILEEIDLLCVGRLAKKVRRKRDYFEKHRDRMQYWMFARDGVPEGSGSTESMGRQVYNMRLKASGMFWTPENAEALTMMRCYLVAGRWDQLASMVMYFRARRFDEGHPSKDVSLCDTRARIAVQIPIRPTDPDTRNTQLAKWAQERDDTKMTLEV